MRLYALFETPPQVQQYFHQFLTHCLHMVDHRSQHNGQPFADKAFSWQRISFPDKILLIFNEIFKEICSEICFDICEYGSIHWVTFSFDSDQRTTKHLKFNLLRPSDAFSDDIFKWIFFNENVSIVIKISLKFVPQGPIDNTAAVVQIMTWRCPGNKPLSEPMMVTRSWKSTSKRMGQISRLFNFEHLLLIECIYWCFATRLWYLHC